MGRKFADIAPGVIELGLAGAPWQTLKLSGPSVAHWRISTTAGGGAPTLFWVVCGAAVTVTVTVDGLDGADV